MNNNIVITVPIRSKAGYFPYTMNAFANSYMSVVGGNWNPSMMNTAGYYNGPFISSANSFVGPLSAATFASSTATTCMGTAATKYSGFFITGGDGATHAIDPTLYTTSDSRCNHTLSALTTDGTGLTISVTGSIVQTVYDKSGNSIYVFAMQNNNSGYLASITNPRGKFVGYTGGNPSYTWVDTMGMTAVTSDSSYRWTDINGGTPTVAPIRVANQAWQTSFACTTPHDTNGVATITTGFTLADGRSLGITYEPNGAAITGRLKTITLPESGTITYTYSGGTNGIDCIRQVTPTLTRTLGNGEVTKYTLTYSPISGSNYKAVNTVIDMGGNETDYQFTGFTATGNAASPTAQVVTQITRYQGNGSGKNLLQTNVYCYNTAFASCSPSTAGNATVSYPMASVIVFSQMANMTTWAAVETHYDNYGNVTSHYQYDYGKSTASTGTVIQYGTYSGGSCTSIAPVQDRVCQTQSYEADSNGNLQLLGTNTYTYDSYGEMLTTSINGVGQTTPNFYDSDGAIGLYYDVANNATNFGYDSSRYTQCTGCTGYPFPTSVIMCDDSACHTYHNWLVNYYYGEGGVLQSTEDANLSTTTLGYTNGGGTADPYWRLSSVTDPLGTTEYYSYPTASLPTESSRSMTFGSSIEAEYSTTDAYNRVIDLQVPQTTAQAAYDTSSNAYAWNGNYSQVQRSQPCTTTVLGAPCPSLPITLLYDPLGRIYSSSTTSNETVSHAYSHGTSGQDRITDLVTLKPASTGENTKKTETLYDGLGRVVNVCYIGNGQSATCTGDSANTGLNQSYAYAAVVGTPSYEDVKVTRGSQTREDHIDALGRVLQAITPEGGAWNYKYDSDSSCPSGYQGMNGMMASTRDPNGNVLCYAYDAERRIIGVNANGTTCRHFYYDNSNGYSGTIPSGITATNPYQRMVEAATDSCTANTLITDEWFAYDAAGRMTNLWELTPHSTQYYGSTATYFANGVAHTLQLASPNLYTVTYGSDGEGRWSSLADSTHSKTVVSSTTYFPASNPDGMTIAGTDSASYTYDTNTARMTKYQFTVNGVSMTGALTWNPNGTLNKLAITDGFNAGGTQNCNFNPSNAANTGYDDWARLVGVDCGSGNLGDIYGYDIYDNLTETIMSGHTGFFWNPGYSSTNNHYTSGSYDSNGNVTNDGSFVYGWNEFSKMKSAATSGTPSCGTSGHCIIYDAFGRIVETSVNSTWKERWITPLGSTANMSGTTINFAYFPAPHGGKAYFAQANAGRSFMFGDWLSNIRLVAQTTHSVLLDQAFAPYGENYAAFGSTSTAAYDTFAGMTQNFYNGVTAESDNREYSMAAGRWLSPDPAHIGWNQYAYPSDPNTFIDPSGLCTIFIGGVKDNSNNAALNAAANSVGGIYVPPYDGQSTLSAILNIAAQALAGPLGSTQDVADAVNQIQSDPNGIQIVAFSGGAQAFSMAAQSGAIEQDQLQNITQITYLSPGLGPFGSLYKGPDTTVFHGHGVTDFGATFFARLSGNKGAALPCGHNFNCEFNALDQSIKSNLTPCPKSGHYGNSGSAFDPTPLGGGGGGNTFGTVCQYDEEGHFFCYNLFLPY